ncbi:MAG TPA: homocysteine S-methyltransferase [Spirochaetota bacterium]|nr:homocysteine S-methyltransferase [Spirochaetota bacterium]HPJ35056.1 homocysteine S-methyltransferase [Spirochaetota bacterium]
MNHIAEILAKFPFVVLDGGLATELEHMGFDLRDRLWSAKILAENPDAIMQVHARYLEAGADCIITSSYQATMEGFMLSGFTREESKKLMKLSVRLAVDAVEKFMQSGAGSLRPIPFIAASAGSYGAFLADGSEYRGDYRLSDREYMKFHRERVEILIEAGADFMAFETFPNQDEALAVAELMNEYPDIHYWIVFTAPDGKRISHGELFQDCVKVLAGRGNLSGIGINCSKPELISPLLYEVDKITDIPIVVYPNSGEIFDAGCSCWTEGNKSWDFSSFAEEWYKRGARVIGGCCRTGPDDIKKISLFRNKLLKKGEEPRTGQIS